MSDETVVKTKSEAASAAPTMETSSGQPAKKSLFGNLNSDLRSALDTWEVLTEQAVTKVSPDEVQLKEVKKLLGELKSKLAEFGE